MQNFELPHSKLLWYIQEMYKQHLIDDHEKQQLKEKVIIEQVDIFQYLEQYEQKKDDEMLSQQLIQLVRQKDLGELFGLNIRKNPYQDNSEYEFPGRIQRSPNSGPKSRQSEDLLPPEF
ncbi:unnamed protein product [Paramecium sonneborni]|uniref:Uncharacterized protein n=1 Tax=Paramecium sonneborni TaxID=65129 RepID=A0A8S1M7Q2_9CILI|nr:unnamed protein product [Paramecium sonneborni]